MSKYRDYNSINWSEFLEENQNSPTGIVWKVDRMSGMYLKITTVSAGDNAGFVWLNKKSGQRYFKVTYKGVDWYVHRILWIMRNGSIEESFVIDHISGDTLDNSIDNLRKVKQEVNSRNLKMYNTNTSGKTGVRLMQVSNRTYAVARWQTLEGKVDSKYFNCNKIGLLEAYAKACQYRENMIAKLNTKGADYSDRHGT